NNNPKNYQNELLDDELTPEEELEISGYQPEQVALIDQEFLIEQDNEQAEPQSGSENPLIRFALAKRCCKQNASAVVGGVMGFGWMIWSIFFSPKPVVKAPTPKPTSKVLEKEGSSEAARLKAELALRNQASRNLEQSPVQTPPSPKPKPSKSVRTARKPKRSKPRIIREKVPSPPRIIREKVPSPPKIIRETVPSPPRIIREKVPNKVQPKNTAAKNYPVLSPTKIEKIDPFERWNKLATLGQQTTSLNNNFSNNNQSFEQAQSLPDKSESKSNYTSANTESNSSEIILANASNRVKEPQTPTMPRVEINRSNQLDKNPYANPTPGELGILNRTPPNLQQETITASNSPIQVQIGTSAEASVLVPIIWSEEDNNQERFAVELQEDVLSMDKRVALGKGTILI
ncbi:MAG: hypothetical protein AAFR37_19550, partial [Cyanobacteria bacterium J06628_3]